MREVRKRDMIWLFLGLGETNYTMRDKPEMEVTESEEQLVQTARDAISRCNWLVGECAAKWTRRYAKGRTDADFAAMVGLSPDQVYQRRRVWETFADVADNYPSLKWSHFYVALNWDDAPECLAWAEENQATVAEMKAWRRLQHGEDLTAKAAEDQTESIEVMPAEPAVVRDPADPDRPGAASDGPENAESAGATRGEQGVAGPYAPFRKDALTPPPAEPIESNSVAVKARPTAAQLLRRMTLTLERYAKMMDAEFRAEAEQLPEKARVRFLAAVRDLSEKASKLA